MLRVIVCYFMRFEWDFLYVLFIGLMWKKNSCFKFWGRLDFYIKFEKLKLFIIMINDGGYDKFKSRMIIYK